MSIDSKFSSLQLLSRVWLFVTPRTAARQASLSITNSQSLPKLMSIESVMPSNHLILRRPLLLLPSVFPSIRGFSNESALRIRWPKYWSFSFSISRKLSCSNGMLSWWNWRSFTQKRKIKKNLRLACFWAAGNGPTLLTTLLARMSLRSLRWSLLLLCLLRFLMMWYLSLPVSVYNVIECVNWMYFYEYEPIYRQDFCFTLREHSNCSHQNPFLVILVTSHPSDVKARQAIRGT